tara:strand:+ start:2507 stop:2713 length:207 start_codon:yes stop_codon:yes gene_type:complete
MNQERTFPESIGDQIKNLRISDIMSPKVELKVLDINKINQENDDFEKYMLKIKGTQKQDRKKSDARYQ